jgi:hypothetical protein
MATPESEIRGLKRLAGITWKDYGDGYLTMEGCFTPQGAKDLVEELGPDNCSLLDIKFIARTKATMKRCQAEKVFAWEGLALKIHELGRAI